MTSTINSQEDTFAIQYQRLKNNLFSNMQYDDHEHVFMLQIYQQKI